MPAVAGFNRRCKYFILTMFAFNIPTHGYRVWCRKNEAEALWSPLPYAPRESYEEAEALQDYYEGEWGTLYEYSIVACGSRPVGMCVPYI